MSITSKLQDDYPDDSAVSDIPKWVLEESKELTISRLIPHMPTDKKNESGYFYIIKTPDVPEGVYKIGKTTMVDPNKRLCRYPTYSCCLYTIHVENADLFEDLVMRKLKLVTKRRMEYGLEY